MAVQKQEERPAPSLADYDEETQDILKQMHKEGLEVNVPGLDQPDPQAPGTRPAPAAPAPAPTPAPAPAIDPDDEEPGDGVDDGSADENGAGTDDGNGNVVPTSPRQAPRVPAADGKADYWKEQAGDLQSRLDEALEKIAENDRKNALAGVAEKIDQVAKEHNVSPKVITAILELGREAFLPPELKDAVATITAQGETVNYWNGKFDQFDREFEQAVLPALLNENPNITQDEVDQIYAWLGGGNANGLAWSDENASTPLLSLYYKSRTGAPTQRRVSGEPTQVRSRAGAGRPASQGPKALSDMTPGEISNMSDEEFDQYSDGLGNSQPKLNK